MLFQNEEQFCISLSIKGHQHRGKRQGLAQSVYLIFVNVWMKNAIWSAQVRVTIDSGHSALFQHLFVDDIKQFLTSYSRENTQTHSQSKQ